MALSADYPSCAELQAGMAHLAAGRWAEAAASLRIANRREPGRLGVVRALATACLHGGDDAGARRAVAEFVLDNPMCAEGWRLAAQLEWKLNRYDEAMATLARGLERLPNSAALHKQTALFWGARGRLENAARHAERAGEEWTDSGASNGPTHPSTADKNVRPTGVVDPDYLDRLARDPKMLGSLLDLPGDGGDVAMLCAVEHKLAALLESQPHHADRQLVLARLQVRIGALPAAMLSVQRALRANPKYVEAHRLRATILGKVGEFDQAIEILQTLVRTGSDWADVRMQIVELQKARERSNAEIPERRAA